jgi:hypothetical protein
MSHVRFLRSTGAGMAAISKTGDGAGRTRAYKPRSAVGRWLRLGLGTPEFELEEIAQLSELIQARLNTLEPGDDVRHHAWVASRFRYPLRSLLIVSNRDAASYVAITLLIVGGGFATSGIAVAAGAGKGSAGSWIVFAIGLLVALAGAISQQLRFGFRSSERRTLAVTLREEGWHFANLTGDYAPAGRVAFVLFESRLDELHRRIAQVDVLERAPAPSDKAKSERGAQHGASGDKPTAASSNDH